MTNQELLDKNWQWFIVERHEPSIKQGICMYRIDAETKCAIGCATSEEEYAARLANWEDYNLQDAIRSIPSLKGLEDGLYGFPRSLQTAHDSWAYEQYPSYEDYEKRLRFLAEEFKLEIPKENPTEAKGDTLIMNPTEVPTALSTKLSASSQEVFKLAMRHNYTVAAVDTLFMAVGFAIGAAGVWSVRQYDEEKMYDGSFPTWIVLAVALWSIALMAVLVFGVDCADRLINPQYNALNDIVDARKGSS